jgi:putative DNA primase/helicase
MTENVISMDAARDASPIFNGTTPTKSAEEIIRRRFTMRAGGQDLRTLHFWRDDYWLYEGAKYRELPKKELRSIVYAVMGSGVTNERKPFNPTRDIVSDVIDAMEAAVFLDHRIDAPAFIDGQDGPPGSEYLPMKNGLLHLPTLELIPHTPAFFNVYALDFDFDPDAPDPKGWEIFINDLWPDDAESRNTLQELFGLYLTTDTSHQKIGLIVGPKRSGKGTMVRVLREMIGRDNYDSPTLSSLGQNFGLSNLIGKQVAVIADARLSGKSDHAVIAERLLSISGEDAQTIDRKYKSPWCGHLTVRFLLLTNELPRLTDASGALASRFIILRLTESFLGREDQALTQTLLLELPGILNWALDGLARLRERGRLVQPKSSLDAVLDLEDLASPIAAFIRDACEIGPALETSCADMFDAWKTWAQKEGREHPGTKSTLSRDLKAARPEIRSRQVRRHGEVVWVYSGITLQPQYTNGVMDHAFDDANRQDRGMPI